MQQRIKIIETENEIKWLEVCILEDLYTLYIFIEMV